MKILGRAERVDFPEFGLNGQMAKIDTGAFTSSVDCEHIQVVKKDGVDVLEVVFLRPGRDGYTGEKKYLTDFEHTEIKNANGVQQRYVIFTDMIIHGEQAKARFSLANRSALRYPVLVGRRFLRDTEYVVDVRKGEGFPDDEERRGL
jgi:hypothetical protein